MTSKILTKAKWVVTILTLALNLFVYFYPDLINSHESCKWKEFSDSDSDSAQLRSTSKLVDGLPKIIKEKILLNFPSLQDKEHYFTKSAYDLENKIKDIHLLAFGDPQINGNWPLTKYIKRLDNFGNDYYLGHIYKTMSNRLKPSHVAVMGDLFSSQWIYDTEFYNRTLRYVERLFTRPLEYKKQVLDTHKHHHDYDWVGWLQREQLMDPKARFDSRVYNDVYDWVYPERKHPNYDVPLFINLTGNHDIGYSGDATWQHMARFHLLFGQNNYVINYNKGTPEEWRLVVLDSLTLEGPALQEEFVSYTWSFLEHLDKHENKNFNGSTVLLTHISLYKENGICTDGPEHRYYENYTREPYKNGKLRSQNHLSYDVTQKVLNMVFPEGSKNGVILTGHDHVGCDSWFNLKDNKWIASKKIDPDQERFPVREIVVRSMMGDYDGQTGILTGHFNRSRSSWDFDFHYCSFVVQHWWWASKVTSIIAVLLQSVGYLYGW